MMQPTLQTCFCANSVKNFGQILKFAKLIKIDLRIFTFIFFFFTIGFIQAQTQSAFFEQWAHERGEQQFIFLLNQLQMQTKMSLWQVLLSIKTEIMICF